MDQIWEENEGFCSPGKFFVFKDLKTSEFGFYLGKSLKIGIKSTQLLYLVALATSFAQRFMTNSKKSNICCSP